MCTGGHRVSMALTQIAVSKRDRLLYRERETQAGGFWKVELPWQQQAMRDAAWSCDVMLFMEGVWVWGLPSDEQRERSGRLKLETRVSGGLRLGSFYICVSADSRLWRCFTHLQPLFTVSPDFCMFFFALFQNQMSVAPFAVN